MFVYEDGRVNRRRVLSVYLLDYLKCKSLLFNLNLFDGKIILSGDIPLMFSISYKKMTAREVYELITFVDYIFEIETFITKMSKFNNAIDKFIHSFPNLDLSVFANKNKNKYIDLIFEKYPTIKKLHDYVFELKKDFMRSREKNKISFEMLNFKVVFDEMDRFTENKDFIQFIEDFSSICSKSISLKIEEKLLLNVSSDELFFTGAFPSAILDKKNGILHPIYYHSTRGKTNGMVSLFSSYVYSMMYIENLKSQNKNYFEEIREISNMSVLDKIFHLRDTEDRLINFIDFVANKDFAKDLMKNNSSLKELISLIDSNLDIFMSDSKDSIFVIYMIIDFRQKLEEEKESIKKEIQKILAKDLKVSFKLAEIELYIRSIIDFIMEEKKVTSHNNDLNKMFYSSINSSLYQLIDDVLSDPNYDGKAFSNIPVKVKQ